MKTIELFQWDLNKKVPCSFPEAHFACVGSEDALIVKANGGNAQIPNVLLQEGKDIMVWMMEDGAVADSGRIRIVTRAKPADYIYTETEVITFESLVAKVEDVIAKGNAATDSATTAALKADAAANKANAVSGKAAQVEAEIKASEARRVEAEQGRAEAEATRAANESKRTESFNTNLTSWNSKVDAACKKATDTASKAAQDAKTATDAAIAKTEEATQAAVAKAQTATDNATTAANKAETVVAQLPIPSGNVLKGEAESTFINLHDSWKAPILQGKVLGQSNQVTTTGKNLANGMEEICSSSDLPTSLQKYCWGYSLGQNPLKLNQPLKAGIYTFSYYADKMATIYFSQAPYNGTNEQFAINKKAIGETKNGLNRYYGTVELKNDSDIIGIYSDYKKCCCGMLSEGTSLLPYEPYTGGKPSPSLEYPQEITNLNKAELVITGKNLINPNRLAQIDSSYYQAVDGQLKVINSYNAAWKDVPIYGTLQAGTYTLSGDNIEIRDTALNQIVNIMSTQVKQFTLNNPTSIKMKVGYGWPKYPVITKAQLEVGSKATAYEPHKSKNTVIDLKGNELCSLPNGVKDEVVIDAEGNVSLIKRVAKIDALTVNLKFMQKQNNNKWVAFKSFPEITSGSETKGAISSKFIHKYMLEDGAQYGNFTITTDGNLCFGIPESLCPKEGDWASVTPEVNAWFDGLKEGLFIYVSYKKPQTIPLGKVELPALPEATSNVWNDGNIPANVYVQYLKDVNIAYTDLENQIKQITAALSVMDTPTVIPEMAWGTPAAI